MNANKPHIIIDSERNIIVPEELKKIGVQYDHNINTLTFDCPRFWDGHDFVTFDIFICYELPDGTPAKYTVDNITVDAADTSIIHFDWTISRLMTSNHGHVKVMLCAEQKNEDCDFHWNSEINNDMYIPKGLSCENVPINPLFYTFLARFGQDIPELAEFDVVTLSDSWDYENEIIAYGEHPIVRLIDIEYLNPNERYPVVSNAVVFTSKKDNDSSVIYYQTAVCDDFNTYVRTVTLDRLFGDWYTSLWTKLG